LLCRETCGPFGLGRLGGSRESGGSFVYRSSLWLWSGDYWLWCRFCFNSKFWRIGDIYLNDSIILYFYGRVCA
jgi:hypothetical protein